jgi:RNA polymerase sigma factor (sigma-70 family)
MTDRDAALELYTEHEGRIVAVAVGRFGGGPDRDYAATRSDAMLGLWRAAQTYDPQHGIPFRAWAWLKVDGTVRDGIRARTGFRRPGRAEAIVISFDETPPAYLQHSDNSSNGDTLISLIPDQRAAAAIEQIDARLTVSWALDSLPARQRYVIEQHDIHDRTLLAIAGDLGVSEARISQLRSSALKTLRAVCAATT